MAKDKAALGAIAMFILGGLLWLTRTWIPVEDLAITELEVRRLTSAFPLSGPYSSLPFRHPGPALFISLWPIYALFGERSSALLTANIWLGGLALGVALAAARRLGGNLLAVGVTAGIAVWSLERGHPILLQPWNPYVGAIPTVTLILLTWALVEGKAKALPFAVVLSTWMVQAHIQFIPTSILLMAVGVIGLAIHVYRIEDTPRLAALAKPVAISVGLGVLLWAPVVYDVLANGTQSNPAAIVRYLRDGNPHPLPKVMTQDVVGIARSQLSLQPTWAGGPRPYSAYLSPGAVLTPWLVLLVIAAGLVAFRRRAWIDLRGLAVAALAFAGSIAGIAQIRGPIGSWYLVAIEASAITLVSISIMSLVRSVLESPRAIHLLEKPEALGVVYQRSQLISTTAVVLFAGLAVVGMRTPDREITTAHVAAQMRPAIEKAIDGNTVLLQARSGYGGWIQSTLALQLERSGYNVFATTTLAGKYPRDMEAPPPPGTTRLVVVTDPPPDVEWDPSVTVVTDASYQLEKGHRKTHVVVVEAPLDLVFLIVK